MKAPVEKIWVIFRLNDDLAMEEQSLPYSPLGDLQLSPRETTSPSARGKEISIYRPPTVVRGSLTTEMVDAVSLEAEARAAEKSPQPLMKHILIPSVTYNHQEDMNAQ
ncbi:hypothetical protein LIER_21087 [Lithospermum erythrorhizon]|uniref:Uncharacterized protein n=1 Tax=Lithospermum erythrorhizon TaxID=34254 RepID=A0AAV3QNW5_LITER